MKTSDLRSGISKDSFFDNIVFPILFIKIFLPVCFGMFIIAGKALLCQCRASIVKERVEFSQGLALV